MRVLLIGVGTVGEAIARMAAQRDWCEQMVLADYDAERAAALQASWATRHASRSSASMPATARPWPSWPGGIGSTLVMNAVDPRFVMPLFDGALAAGVDYMDMANSLSRPHPSDPFSRPGVKLGDEQLARKAEWDVRRAAGPDRDGHGPRAIGRLRPLRRRPPVRRGGRGPHP